MRDPRGHLNAVASVKYCEVVSTICCLITDSKKAATGGEGHCNNCLFNIWAIKFV
jgi:hypothetical protein